MEITIDQALQQSDVAHREGKIEEAERIYQSILYTQPTHPDANHNLGALYVSLDKSEIALPLFRMSLKVNPNIEHFWISYITTLIKLRQFANAKQALNNAKKNGVTKKKLNILKQDLVLQVNGSAPSHSDINTLIQYYQDDKLVYGPRHYTRSRSVNRGPIGYAHSMDDGNVRRRIGNNPLLVEAVSSLDDINLTVSNMDAERIRDVEKKFGLLTNCKVLVLLK